MSSNVKVYGAIYSAESCSYDPDRGVIVVPNRGVPQNVQTNNAWISFLNHDGSVHTARWIGIATPGPQRANSTPPLVLNEPLGSDIVNGILYLADRDGGTSQTDPQVSVVRTFNMKTGLPGREIRVEKSTGFNDIAIGKDGTIYGTHDRRRRRRHGLEDCAGWYRVDLFAERAARAAQRRRDRSAGQHRGRQHRQPGCDHFSPDAKVLKTEKAAQAGNDGLVIMADAPRREQRRQRRRLAHPSEPGGRTDRAELPSAARCATTPARTSW